MVRSLSPGVRAGIPLGASRFPIVVGFRLHHLLRGLRLRSISYTGHETISAIETRSRDGSASSLVGRDRGSSGLRGPHFRPRWAIHCARRPQQDRSSLSERPQRSRSGRTPSNGIPSRRRATGSSRERADRLPRGESTGSPGLGPERWEGDGDPAQVHEGPLAHQLLVERPLHRDRQTSLATSGQDDRFPARRGRHKVRAIRGLVRLAARARLLHRGFRARPRRGCNRPLPVVSAALGEGRW